MTKTFFIDVGDAGAPIGSPSWCRYAHGTLCELKRRTDSEVSRLKYSLIEFKKHERWKQLTDKNGKKFLSWEDYLQYPEPDGLGMPPASAKLVIEELDDKRLLGDVLAADAKDQANQRPPGRPPKETVSNENDVTDSFTGRPHSGTRAEALRRLRKDRRDIHARVLAGELSPHAGMVEAGFRKPRKKMTERERWQKRLGKLSKSTRRLIWEMLLAEFER